eukprot:720430_1
MDDIAPSCDLGDSKEIDVNNLDITRRWLQTVMDNVNVIYGHENTFNPPSQGTDLNCSHTTPIMIKHLRKQHVAQSDLVAVPSGAVASPDDDVIIVVHEAERGKSLRNTIGACYLALNEDGYLKMYYSTAIEPKYRLHSRDVIRFPLTEDDRQAIDTAIATPEWKTPMQLECPADYNKHFMKGLVVPMEKGWRKGRKAQSIQREAIANAVNKTEWV